jgi:phosphate transport system permease protein
VSAPDLRARPSWRSAKSRLLSVLTVVAVVAIAMPLAAVVLSLVARGGGIVLASFPDFFTEEIPKFSRRVGPGMGPAIVGTLLLTAAATAMAVPLGVLGAVYLHEYGGTGKLARLVRFMATVMTGVPSIVMGLFVYVVWTIQQSVRVAAGLQLQRRSGRQPSVSGAHR